MQRKKPFSSPSLSFSSNLKLPWFLWPKDDDWVVVGLEVYDKTSDRRGGVRSVAHRICMVLFEGDSSPSQIDPENLLPVRPQKGDMVSLVFFSLCSKVIAFLKRFSSSLLQICVIRGDHRGEVGSLLNIEGLDGIVKTPEWNILSIDKLCKYSPVPAN